VTTEQIILTVIAAFVTTSLAAYATNIPTGGLIFQPASIIKSLGGTSRTVEVDAYWYHLEFTTAR
jgi:hypothetical protein